MTNTNIASSSSPRHLSLTKALFYVVMLGIAVQAAYLIINAIYFITIPASSISITDTGRSYFIEGIGQYQLSYSYLSFSREITDIKLFVVSACIVEFLVHSLPLVMIMKWGKKLLKTLTHSYTPFTLETTFLIKKIGRLMVLIGLFSKLTLQVSMNMINFHEINFTNPWELEWILIGTITLLVADIFARGCYLQQEVDETL